MYLGKSFFFPILWDIHLLIVSFDIFKFHTVRSIDCNVSLFATEVLFRKFLSNSKS